jgi:ADP-ribose pyrophosphatase YjhB (NUDIX family)
MKISENTVLGAGPIIIEDGKILLCREIKFDGEKSPIFMLPGGRVEESDTDFEETCKREAKDELGIDIEILRPLRTLFVKRPGKDGYALLVHFLAKRTSEVVPGKQILEWGWYDINNLPENVAPSIPEVLQSYLSEKKL